ncbi:MAG TPA: FAD/NAD(P)-binding protein [Pirellulaceae bacterium]|nr:FAD/NAD(P)-binding protein [Pirellulaceae bacterium]
MSDSKIVAPAEARHPWVPMTAVIETLQRETPGVATYALQLTDATQAANYSFQPGQFNMLYLPGHGEVAISLSGRADPGNSGFNRPDRLIHTIREAGSVTQAIARLGVGGRLALRGPFGKPWPSESMKGCDIVLVGGGIGLAPLRPLLYTLLDQRGSFGRCVLLYGARSADHLLYAADYHAWAATGLEIHTTVDRPSAGWNGNVGVVPLLIDRLRLGSARNTLFLMCGPEVMMRFSARAALERGIAADRIWVSLERHMQCAVGLCGHCQLGTELLCRDGPVFRWDRVEPLLHIHDL